MKGGRGIQQQQPEQATGDAIVTRIVYDTNSSLPLQLYHPARHPKQPACPVPQAQPQGPRLPKVNQEANLEYDTPTGSVWGKTTWNKCRITYSIDTATMQGSPTSASAKEGRDWPAV